MTNSSNHDFTLVEQTENDDLYRSGPQPGGVLYVIPGIWTGMPDDLLALMRARRRANVTGRCPLCGAEAEAEARGRQMVHEDYCGTADDRVGPLLATWGHRVGRYARGQRITEDPSTAGSAGQPDQR